MRINHNIPALVSRTARAANDAGLQKTIRRLSAGLRINAAAADAAGLAISEKMRAQIRGTDQAVRNSQDGVSMLQTAEGALTEIHSMLHRMRELAVQAANDTLTSQDRAFVQLEIDKLREAVGRVAGTTRFNRKRLLDGSSSVLWASDRLATEVLARGVLSAQDRFGRTATAEGNYRIELTATPGAGQVRKSSILRVAADEIYEPKPVGNAVPPTPDYIINIDSGTDASGATSGAGWKFDGTTGTLTITGSGTFKITGSTKTNHITVAPGVAANV
ncbi:MAG: flagellin, partial [Synergistaceae bacterium]|nr:flagellin [Synergistaceae bacterium]